MIKSDDCGGIRPELAFNGGAKLFVDEKDYDKVKEILEKEE